MVGGDASSGGGRVSGIVGKLGVSRYRRAMSTDHCDVGTCRYVYSKVAFVNGDVKNEAGTNEVGCPIPSTHDRGAVDSWLCCMFMLMCM